MKSTRHVVIKLFKIVRESAESFFKTLPLQILRHRASENTVRHIMDVR